MNIAIVIGVDEYVDPTNNLPGCKRDTDVICNILDKTEKYEDKLYIRHSVSSSIVKNQFADFITRNRSNKIEEIFFYFTGHGQFLNEEFYYILHDYDSSKRNQTSLQNDEIDSMFRSLNPNILIKVIDACQSGKSYIKESGAVDKYFKSTKDKFNNCYFLSSSLENQSSYQSNDMSEFTKSFVDAIKIHGTAEIRYKDIIDFISDEFENNLAQKPLFVIQANFTEKFCTINSKLKDYLNSISWVSSVVSAYSQGNESVTLIDKIKEDAKMYYTKQQALTLVDKIKTEMQLLEISVELENIYNLKIQFEPDYKSVIHKNVICDWLDNNNHEYFAKTIKTRQRKDRFTNPIGNSLSLLSFNSIYDDTLYEWVRSGFDIGIEVPYKTISITIESNFPNVDSYNCQIIYFLSKKQIIFFYFITDFESEDWENSKLNSDIEWTISEYFIYENDNIIKGLKSIFKFMISTAKENIELKLKNTKSQSEIERNQDN